MSLFSGDLTTPARAALWSGADPANPPPIYPQLISSMSSLIYGAINRGRTYSQRVVRTFDGVGNMQLVLPDYPVTSVISVQMGQTIIPPSILPNQGQPQPSGSNPGYGWRVVPWDGNLPGENAVLELVGGFFWTGAQNVRVTYVAGYLVAAESGTVPATGPYEVTVQQLLGIWCRDNGVMYADGTALVPVSTLTGPGQYIPPSDLLPGVYTFDVADANADVLISYSIIPATLEEACNQMVAERDSYRTRIGQVSKSLGGQETIAYMRGGVRTWARTSSLPPEVMDLLWPYVNVVPPAIGAPV